MEKEEVLKSLKDDLDYYHLQILEISQEIISSGFSKYPIFIAHQYEVQIGELILDKNDFQKNWSINATTLEELVETGLIEENKQKDFVKIYKDPKKNMCVFLVTENSGSFIFYPYPEKKK